MRRVMKNVAHLVGLPWEGPEQMGSSGNGDIASALGSQFATRVKVILYH